MDIQIGMDRDFELAINELATKYGENFEILNGFHSSQLDFSEFINAFVDKNVADVTIDANANANGSKDIRSLISEKGKSIDKMFAFNKIFCEIKKEFGLKVAKEWLENEYSGKYYLHDAPSTTFIPYCYAYDVSRLATEGLFFLKNYNNQPPKHLTTFMDDLIEYISFFCNRSSGAVGLPNIIPWTFYFWKKDVENGYYTESPNAYLRQAFQKLIFRLNQPFLRIDQSAFTNVSIFDREYLVGLFGGMEFPDGTFAVDYLEEIIEVQKVFMEVVSEIRETCMFTFPVLTFSLLYKDGKFVDEEFARWASKHNMKWNDSNFFISDNVGVLSNCCFDGSQKVVVMNNGDVNLISLEDLYKSETKDLKTIYKGRWVPAKVVKYPSKQMYKVVTSLGDELICTEDHLHPTPAGDKRTDELTIFDKLRMTSSQLEMEDTLNPNLYNYTTGVLMGLITSHGVLGHHPGKGSYVCFLAKEKHLDDIRSIIKKTVQLLNNEATSGGKTTLKYEDCVKETKFGESPTAISIYSDALYGFAHACGVNSDTFDFSMNILKGGHKFVKGFVDGAIGIKDNIFYTDNDEVFIDKLKTVAALVGEKIDVDTSRSFFYNVHNPASVEEDNPEFLAYRKKLSNLTDECSRYVDIVSVEKIQSNNPFVYCLEITKGNDPYFVLPNGIITHNCRLLSDTTKLDAFVNSIGGTALSIGSLKVNTINLMRIAIESNKDENAYLENLKETVLLDCKALDRIRHIIKRNIDKGLLPNYVDGGVDIEKQYLTVGILGIFEVIEYFGYTYKDEFGNVFYKDEGLEFAKKIFDVINTTKDQWAEDKDYSCNVESVPAERAAVILAQKDVALYGKEIVGDKFIYSNQFIPLTAKTTIQEKLRVDAELCKLCGGGVISHINLENNFPNEEMAWDMLNTVAESGVIYSAFCTKINECENHHGFVGSDFCPTCGGGVADTYQRIVGFLTPSRNYSKERKKEFSMRQWWDFAQDKTE